MRGIGGRSLRMRERERRRKTRWVSMDHILGHIFLGRKYLQRNSLGR
jgi:hypothetical protein